MERNSNRIMAPIPIVRRIKVLSMGNAGVGKSCLIKRYCEEKYSNEYVATIGIDYGVKTVKYSTEDSKRFNLVKVNFWDIGGDPVYFDIRNEFYKDTHGVNLAYLGFFGF